ncbi:unnamed protein product [Brachionus calyciflorus]|uniref:BEN domain-containing protein n=1 Tax=Brachionus calyciflorus TaxID=104777 RepID=A0A814ADN8_9BILA|nr:unnamed protein product [Brachionus calyciflorus]
MIRDSFQLTAIGFKSQTSIILNVQQKLEDILTIQNVIVQNQHDMYDKLNEIESRLVNVESRIFRQSQQQLPTTSSTKTGLLHPNTNPQRLSFLPLLQNLRLPHKRGQEATETEESEIKESEEKRSCKRLKSEVDSPGHEIEEGEINLNEDNKGGDPGTSSKVEDDLEEESDADDDDDQSTESSSTINLNYSQKSSKSTPPIMHRSSMPHSILQSLATQSLLSSLQPRQNDINFLATDETTGRLLLEESEIRRIYATSKSRGNFSALLVQKMYSKDERVVSNVMGTRGKRQLSPHRMTVVRRLSFCMYPVNDDREEELVWKKECVKAIDSKNRKVRTHHGVKTEPPCSAPPGGLPSTPSSSSLSGINRAGLIAANSRLINNRQHFSMGLGSLSQNPGHLGASNPQNALAIAMAAAAAAAVASNTGNRSPKLDNKFSADYPNS